VKNARKVYLDGSEVGGSGYESACPTNTRTYSLFVEGDDSSVERKVTVNAILPYPPPGHSPSMGCYPWDYSDGVTYYSPTVGCSRPADICLEPGYGCGKPAADAWCDRYTPYSVSSSWVEGYSISTTRYIGTENTCWYSYGYSCIFFESITCDYTP
jgi:hypothetical protein